MIKHRLCAIVLASAAIVMGSTTAAHGATLLHHYDFASGAVDLVGTENGTLFGGASISSGHLNLDGNGDYVQFGTHLVPTTGSYSVALFGQRNADQVAFTEMISQGSSGGVGFYIGTDPSGNIRASDQWASTGVPFGGVGSFTHYALVVDAGTGSSTLYVNGAVRASLPSAITSNPAGTDTRLGRQFAPFDEYFNGVLDDVRIYSGALTSQEVAALAAASVPEPATYALLVIGLALIGANANSVKRNS